VTVPARGAGGMRRRGARRRVASASSGEGRAPASRPRRAAGARIAQAPYVLVLAASAGALGWLWERGVHGVRSGTLALAGALFAAALARLVLPESRLGMLASRRRLTDVITLVTLATGLLVGGLLLSVPS
jgi:Protein of unknown function (DUF3017)